MSKHDIQFALDWLSWRLFARNRRYSQEYLDKMAAKKLREAVSSEYCAQKVKDAAKSALEAAEISPERGKIDRDCNTICKNILREAKEEDFVEMLENNTRKLVEWRKLWDGFRGNHIRRI